MSTSVTWLVNGPLFAMGIGFMVFISREMGAEAFDNVKRASVQAVIVTVVTGIGVGVLTLAVSPILPTWMGVDPAIKNGCVPLFCDHLPSDALPQCDHYFRSAASGSGRYKDTNVCQCLYESCEYRPELPFYL